MTCPSKCLVTLTAYTLLLFAIWIYLGRRDG